MSLTPHIVNSGPPTVPFIVRSVPVAFGTDRYVAVKSEPADGSSTTFNIGRSTDGGITWTLTDTAHAPTFGSAVFLTQAIGFAYDSTRIYLAMASDPFVSTSSATIFVFNMSTNLWEAPITGGPTVDPIDVVTLHVLSSGDKLLTWNIGSPQELKFAVYSGGWGAETTINPGNRTVIMGQALDPSDRLHSIVLTSGNYRYVQIAGGAPGSLKNTGTSTPDFFGDGIYVPSTGQIVFPASENNILALKCSPAAAPTVFSLEIVATGQEHDRLTSIALSPDGTTERVFWMNTDAGVPANNELRYSDQVAGTTTWGAVQVLWNYAANTPVPTPPVDIVDNFTSINWFPEGCIGALIASEFELSAQNFCEVTFYLDTCTSPPGPSRKFLPQYIKRPNNANA